MTQRENNIRQAELDLKESQADLRKARHALETGTRRAKVQFEEEVNRLANEIATAAIEVERNESWLEKARADKEKPFTNSED